MKKTSAFLAWIALAGCGGPSPKDVLPKEIEQAYAEMAESAAKAPDLASFQKALHDGGARIVTLYNKAQTLPKAHQKMMQAELERLNEEGSKRVDQALEKFHERFRAGPNPRVDIETSAGVIRVELYDKLAPITVANFLKYVDDKFYDRTIFHRVIPTFMIQGGGFQPGMKEKPTRGSIKNESANFLPNQAGTLAMARTNEPDSASAQFFINVKDNGFLNRRESKDGVGYAVFGKVIDGMDVVNKIKDVPTRTLGEHADVPERDVIIETIRRVPEDEKKKH